MMVKLSSNELTSQKTRVHKFRTYPLTLKSEVLNLKSHWSNLFKISKWLRKWNSDVVGENGQMSAISPISFKVLSPKSNLIHSFVWVLSIEVIYAHNIALILESQNASSKKLRNWKRKINANGPQVKINK